MYEEKYRWIESANKKKREKRWIKEEDVQT